MLSQPYPKLELNVTAAHQDDLTKATRLSETRKGADFTRVVNDLADQQWRGTTVMPRIVEMEERGTPKRDYGQYKFDEPQLLQTSTPIKPIPPSRATPLKPISRHDYSSRSSLGTVSRELRGISSRQSSLMSSILNNNDTKEYLQKSNRTDNYQKMQRNNINNNNNYREFNTSDLIARKKQAFLPDISGDRDPKTSMDLQELYFNTFGSRDLGMESRLVPEQIPRVIAPKQYVPSSRVGSQKHSRHLRTETDFRSRNGLVHIVKPLKPLPSIAQFQYPQTDLVDDLENIGREKTYVTLRRIDQILNPQQSYIQNELNSSEMEILGSGSSTPVSVKKKVKEKPERKRSSGSYINQSGGVTVLHTYPNGHVKIPAAKTVTPLTLLPQQRLDTFSSLLKTLESERLPSYEKCSKWIDKCSKWH